MKRARHLDGVVRSLLIVGALLLPTAANDLKFFLVDEKNLPLVWGIDVVLFCLVPATVLIVMKKRGVFSARDLGLEPAFHPVSIVAGVVMGLVLLVFRNIAEVLVHWMPFAVSLPGRHLYPEDRCLRILVILYFSVSAGILEELIHRGAITALLRRHLRSVAFCVVLSAAIFAGAHWMHSAGMIVCHFFWALIPTLWYVKRGTIWTPIVAHIIYDSVAMYQDLF